jgi:hypothetical protein
MKSRRFNRLNCICCPSQDSEASYWIDEDQVRGSLQCGILAWLRTGMGQNLPPRSAPACLLPPNADIGRSSPRAEPTPERLRSAPRPMPGPSRCSASNSASARRCADPSAHVAMSEAYWKQPFRWAKAARESRTRLRAMSVPLCRIANRWSPNARVVPPRTKNSKFDT